MHDSSAARRSLVQSPPRKRRINFCRQKKIRRCWLVRHSCLPLTARSKNSTPRPTTTTTARGPQCTSAWYSPPTAHSMQTRAMNAVAARTGTERAESAYVLSRRSGELLASSAPARAMSSFTAPTEVPGTQSEDKINNNNSHNPKYNKVAALSTPQDSDASLASTSNDNNIIAPSASDETVATSNIAPNVANSKAANMGTNMSKAEEEAVRVNALIFRDPSYSGGHETSQEAGSSHDNSKLPQTSQKFGPSHDTSKKRRRESQGE